MSACSVARAACRARIDLAGTDRSCRFERLEPDLFKQLVEFGFGDHARLRRPRDL
jgi:hypothetical protein